MIDAALYFSNILKKWIPNICQSDPTKPLDEQGLLPELKKAVIACHGSLTPSFQYITKLREERSADSMKKLTQSKMKEKEAQIIKKAEKDEDDLTNSILQKK